MTMKVIKSSTDVLVIGSGAQAVKLAVAVNNAGYKAVIYGKYCTNTMSQVSKETNIEILYDETLVTVTGEPCDFNVTLKKGTDNIERKFGSIVVINDFEIEHLNENYNLKLADNVITLSKLEELIDADNVKLNNIAFLMGFAQEGTFVDTERVLRSMEILESMDKCNTYLYINNMKVAHRGIEKLFTDVRDKGATFFKLTKAPKIVQTDSTLNILFYDPVIRKNVEHTPDIIVVEEKIRPSYTNLALSKILRIDITELEFLQKNNVHRLQVNSNREGIFVAGHARDVMDDFDCLVDIDNVVLRLKELFGDSKKTLPVIDKAVVDTDKCAICLTCYRSCPHGAITIDDDKVVISSIACQGCGICASECPMDAIEINGFTDNEVKVQIKQAISQTKEDSIIVLCCKNSAMEAFKMATAFEMPLPKSISIIEVPCAGKIDIEYILSAFIEGASGVMVLACHEGNCKSEYGNIFAKWRINDLYDKMEKIGLDKKRLQFATVASNMGANFVELVNEMSKKL